MARRSSGIRLAALKAAQRRGGKNRRLSSGSCRSRRKRRRPCSTRESKPRAYGRGARWRSSVCGGRPSRTRRPSRSRPERAWHVLRGLTATNAEVAALCGLSAKEVRDALSAPRASVERHQGGAGAARDRGWGGDQAGRASGVADTKQPGGPPRMRRPSGLSGLAGEGHLLEGGAMAAQTLDVVQRGGCRGARSTGKQARCRRGPTA